MKKNIRHEQEHFEMRQEMSNFTSKQNNKILDLKK